MRNLPKGALNTNIRQILDGFIGERDVFSLSANINNDGDFFEGVWEGSDDEEAVQEVDGDAVGGGDVFCSSIQKKTSWLSGEGA